MQTGTLTALRGLTRTSVDATTRKPANGLELLPGVHGVVVEGRRVHFDVDTAQLDAAMKTLSQLGLDSLTSRPPTLEELFLRQFGDTLDGQR